MKLLLIFLLLFISSCNNTPSITDQDLDGNLLFDPSLYEPEKYLVSAYKPNPSDQEKQMPVLIAAHGYSATTFEWDELRNYADSVKSGILISQVLLGGHGRTYADFKNSTWRDWQASILLEYKKLVQAGYTNISFIGSSTGCPLILNLLYENYLFQIPPHQIILIDPIIVPSNKILSLAGIVGPMIGYTSVDFDSELERKHWYHYRPQETLQELLDIITVVRQELESGITLPTQTDISIYKSTYDEVADRVSGILIYNGIKSNSFNSKDIYMINSHVHVMTRLQGRNNVTDNDISIQKNIFNQIIEKTNKTKK
jgi:carboxylesterase